MRCTPTAIASLSLMSMVSMAGVALTTPELVLPAQASHDEFSGKDRPWQTDDGVIHHNGMTFDSWRSFHAFQERNGDQSGRCGVPNYDIDDWRQIEGFMPPSDCSMSNTNPTEEYDPSVSLMRIACVVHVLRNSDGSQGDISQAMVESGIRILNEDFKALSGTNGANGTDCQIEFYLADTDPSGNPTNGITYSNNTTWYNDSGSYYESLAWDPDRYMNIYTNTASGNLGYVPWLPQEGSVGANADRVVVLWESFGENAPIGPPYNLGRTLTHEVGHYLGLHHTFNDGCGGDCSTNGDLVCDTPPQNSATFGCSGSSCSGTPPDDNYMDYSDDACMERFTPEQSRRMRCTVWNYRPQIADETGGEPDYISISQNGTNPTLVPPDGIELSIRITELESNGYVDGSGRLVITSGGTTTSIQLNDLGSDIHAANTGALPCGSTLDWYFTADDAGGATLRFPTGTAVFSAPVALGFDAVFADNVETDQGYTVSGAASDGGWERGIPVSCADAPSTDSDGSGRCWLTDNSADDGCDSDVDGGSTVLTTPPIDASGGNAGISYARYFKTDAGGGCPAGFAPDCNGTCFPQGVYDDWQGDGVCDDGGFIPSEYGYEGAPEGVAIFMNCQSFGCDGGDCTGCDSDLVGELDSLTVELSGDGANWVQIDRVQAGDDDADGDWVTRTVQVADWITPTSEVRIRFTATDAGSDSSVEAGIDAVILESLICEQTTPCPADVDGNGVIDGSDLSLVLGYWEQSSDVADVNDDGTVNGLDLAIVLGGWGACSE